MQSGVPRAHARQHHDAAAAPGDDRIALGLSRDAVVLDAAAWTELLERAHAELRAVVGDGVPVAARCDAGGALLASGSFAADLPAPGAPGAALLASAGTVVRADGTYSSARDWLAEATLERIRSQLADAVPPFGYLARGAGGGPVAAGTDHLGLQHVYVASGAGYAMVCTSSTLAARLAGGGLDERACGVYSLIGNFLADRTMFEGVRKLRPAETVTLRAGQVASAVDTGRVPVMVRSGDWFASQEEAVTAGAAVLEDIVGTLAAAYPSPLLELSGGLDSRVLAAVGRRCGYDGIRTLTIGVPGDPDVTLAERIVADNGLDGVFVPVSLLDDLESADALQLVRRAADQRDFAADPVSGALYDAIEREVPASEQVSGIGGELARGNYFTGQRLQPRFDRDMVERVMRWRLVSNWSAAEALFDPDFRRSAEAALREDAWSYVDGLDAPWPIATDEIYLFARLQPWGGAVYSRRAAGRRILAPLYHPRFVEWASRIPLERKRNSRTFAALLQHVAPDLARLPLDSGLTPYQLADRGAGSRLATRLGDARRVGRKLRRQLSRRGKTPGGTKRLAAALLEAWRADPPKALASVGWLDQGALERAVAGQLELGVASVAFLANLDGALRHLRDRA